MSEIATPLGAARFEGRVRVTALGPMGMITLRGTLQAPEFSAALESAVGAQVPRRLAIGKTQTGSVAWMSPDELLLLCPYADAPEHIEKLTAALADQHMLIADVSDARAMFTLSGANMRDVLTKLAPLDFSPEVFQPGVIRRTRLAQVAAALWLENTSTAHVICFRSVAQYVFDVLSTSVEEGGHIGLWA